MQTINITVPKDWHKLTQKQLRHLFFLLSEEYCGHAHGQQVRDKTHTSEVALRHRAEDSFL